MSPDQCRAARIWLKLSQTRLAAKVKISPSTIRDFESGRRVPHYQNMEAIRRAFEVEGVDFIDDDIWIGIRIRKPGD
jgi:ribosome-binding protein aMBF1 (putative translation factor)